MSNKLQYLLPATAEDLTNTLFGALRYSIGKKAMSNDEHMALDTAEYLVEHLRISGYVVMRKPPKLSPRGSIAS